MKGEKSVIAQTVWIGNATVGGILALLGGMVCCATFGYHVDYLVFGQRLMGFYLGMAGATIGATSTIISLWRIR
jgi:hypothetical protein